jgi:ribosome modulation factor
VSKRQTEENPQHPIWTVGFNARLAGFSKRFNPHQRTDDSSFQWDYGWDECQRLIGEKGHALVKRR